MNFSSAANEERDSASCSGTQAIEAQAQKLHALALSLNGAFSSAVDTILEKEGCLVISGVGKSELVGRKLAATFASIGIPSFFIRPTDAGAGKLGMLRSDSLVLFISTSGETEALLSLIPSIQEKGNKLIALVGKEDCTLARKADISLTLPVRVQGRADTQGPTAATLLTLALGDALAMAVMQKRGIQPGDAVDGDNENLLENSEFSKVRDMMRKRAEKGLPIVGPTANAQEVIWAIIQGRMGMVLVMEGELLAGIITDTDLRNAMKNMSFSITGTSAADIMYWNPATISQDAPLSEAEEIMTRKKIKAVVALDEESRVTGVVEMY